MSFREKDFVLRLIERVASLMASFVKRRRLEEPQVLLEELRREKEEALGMPTAALDLLTVESVRELLGSARAAEAYGRLLFLEAELLDELDRKNEGERLRERARGLGAQGAD